MAEQDLLVFEGKRNGHVHLDLVPPHEVKNAPGGTSSATESDHKDIGVENGVCSSDDRTSGLRSTGSYANHIRCHAAVGFRHSVGCRKLDFGP
jgi:hypothetical protein